MKIDIKELKTKQDLKKFIKFPIELYKKNEYFVPQLYISEKRMLTKANPFLKKSEIKMFIAYDDKKIVGRIAAIYNRLHLKLYNDDTGFFGFFDVENNYAIAKLLFDAALNWLKSKGIIKIIGPTNLTTNDSCGFLIEGFKQAPIVLMPYNYNYYNDFCIKYGFSKSIDLYSYNISGELVDKNISNIANYYEEKLKFKNIYFRNIRANSFKNDIKKLRSVYNQSNKDNWGFLPLNEQEFNSMAKDLRSISSLDYTIIAEKDNEMIGFLIAIPDVNQILKTINNGKLFPFGIFKFLFNKNKIDKARLIILGVLPEYRKQGIDKVMYKKIRQALQKKGIESAEACYVFESNTVMNTILQKTGAKQVKKYRLYLKTI